MVETTKKTFSLTELYNFSVENYSEHFTSKSKNRLSVYHRNAFVIVATMNKAKPADIAKVLGVTHPNVLWAITKSRKIINTPEEERKSAEKLFIDIFKKYYNSYLEVFYEPTTPVMPETSADSKPIVHDMVPESKDETKCD